MKLQYVKKKIHFLQIVQTVQMKHQKFYLMRKFVGHPAKLLSMEKRDQIIKGKIFQCQGRISSIL